MFKAAVNRRVLLAYANRIEHKETSSYTQPYRFVWNDMVRGLKHDHLRRIMKDSAIAAPPAPRRDGIRHSTAGVLSRPLHDFLAALEHCLRESPGANTGVIAFCMLLTWWVYVPLHELLHVLGCIISGGSVSRLDLSPVYGAVFLQRFFPFIHAGSDYAGQLTGFDTAGRDSTYLVTVFLPYALTVIPGVPLLKAASLAATSPRRGSILFGISIPLAYAPFISLTGDYYEMASIITSRLAAWAFPGFNPHHWRSDDLLKLSRELLFRGDTPAGRDAAGIAVSFLLAVVLAFCTYAAGALSAKVFRRKRLKDSLEL